MLAMRRRCSVVIIDVQQDTRNKRLNQRKDDPKEHNDRLAKSALNVMDKFGNLIRETLRTRLNMLIKDFCFDALACKLRY